MKPILQYQDLIQVPVIDSGEPILIVQDVAPEIACVYEKQDMRPYLGDQFALRKGTIERLKNAAIALQKLGSDLTFRLVYAYRHPNVQLAYFEKRREILIQENPNLSQEEMIAKTHLFVASPDVAGHPTCGAVDITIEGPHGPIDMGSGIADFTSNNIETFSEGLSETQQKNRQLLRTILMDAGFAPFDGEWWHFSYGDKEWAAYYQKPNALYDQIVFEK